MPTIARINANLAQLPDGKSIRFLDVNLKLAGGDATRANGSAADLRSA